MKKIVVPVVAFFLLFDIATSALGQNLYYAAQQRHQMQMQARTLQSQMRTRMPQSQRFVPPSGGTWTMERQGQQTRMARVEPRSKAQSAFGIPIIQSYGIDNAPPPMRAKDMNVTNNNAGPWDHPNKTEINKHISAVIQDSKNRNVRNYSSAQR
jgi:hypothetical protein